MKELFVGFELAKLLCDVGFDEPCMANYYRKADVSGNILNGSSLWSVLSDPKQYHRFKYNSIYSINWDNKKWYVHYSAPTYEQVQNWLRDKCGYYIMIYPEFNGWTYNIKKNDNGLYIPLEIEIKWKSNSYYSVLFEVIKQLLYIIIEESNKNINKYNKLKEMMI